MLEAKIKHIKQDISKYENINRADLLTKCIDDKLRATLKKYNLDMELNSDYLLKREGTRVLKALTKLQKKDDKEALLASIEEEEYENE